MGAPARPILNLFSGGFQPRQLGIELETELLRFLLGKPVCHLREDGATGRSSPSGASIGIVFLGIWFEKRPRQHKAR